MHDTIREGLDMLTQALEIAGASALVVGFIVASTKCIGQSGREGAVAAVNDFRKSLGRVVLIGLEILVAATIIKTITFDRTVEGMSLLAIMVAIRTTLGWTMLLEMDGRWPWQKPRPDAVRRST